MGARPPGLHPTRAVLQAAAQSTPQPGPAEPQPPGQATPCDDAAAPATEAKPWKTPAPLMAAAPDTPGTALPASGWQSMLADDEAGAGRPLELQTHRLCIAVVISVIGDLNAAGMRLCICRYEHLAQGTDL